MVNGLEMFENNGANVTTLFYFASLQQRLSRRYLLGIQIESQWNAEHLMFPRKLIYLVSCV